MNKYFNLIQADEIKFKNNGKGMESSLSSPWGVVFDQK
jgi:hypothetical protein